MKLQAFIFCGRGRNLSPFTTNLNASAAVGTATSTANDDNTNVGTTMPKALLPIANRAMIEYVLDWCDQAGFKEINIVASPDEVVTIEEYLKTYLQVRDQQYDIIGKVLKQSNHTHHLTKLAQINFISSKSTSTGEALQTELLDRIVGDFVLLPCDFVTDIPPQILIDQFRNRDKENLAMAVYYKNNSEHIDKSQKISKQFYTIYSQNNNSEKQPVLLDIYSKDDVAKNKYLEIRNHLLWQYPNTKVSTKLLNSFIYFCSYELQTFLKKNEATNAGIKRSNSKHKLNESLQQPLSKIKNELPSMNSTTSVNSINTTTTFEDDNLMKINPPYFNIKNNLIPDSINRNVSLAKFFRDLSRRSWQHSKPRETICMFILPDVTSFIRANNLNSYMEANRFVLKIKAHASSKQGNVASNNHHPHKSSTIGMDSIVAQSCTILEKSNIKMSAIASNAQIGNRCRISGSIVLPNAIVEDEVILENVIIGPTSNIGRKTKLTNCYVEGLYSVNPKSAIKGETLKKLYFDNDYASDAMESESDEDESDDYSEEYYDNEDFEDDGLFER